MGTLFFAFDISSQYNRENQTLNNGIEAKQLFIIEEEEWINEQTAKSAQCVCECDPSIFNKKFQIQRIDVIKNNHKTS